MTCMYICDGPVDCQKLLKEFFIPNRALKYGFCKNLLLYKYNSDTFFIQIRFGTWCKSNFDQLVRVAFVQK